MFNLSLPIWHLLLSPIIICLWQAPVTGAESLTHLPYINSKNQVSFKKLQNNRFDAHEYIWLVHQEKRSKFEWEYFYQDRLRLVDPVADFALCQNSARVGENLIPNILNAVLGWEQSTLDSRQQALVDAKKLVADWGKDSYPELMDRLAEIDQIDLAQAGHADESNESKRPSIKVDEFVDMLERIMWEEYHNRKETHDQLYPTVGQFHDYSPEFRYKLKQHCGSPAQNIFSRLLLAFASGVSWRVMRTGSELALMRWMVSQDVGTILPNDLFRYSYRLNRGNVYLTLLTIENVLARYWKTKGRAQLRHIQSLYHISNIDTVNGDKFGHWYHFFGTMLYSFVMGERLGSLVGDLETWGSRVLSGESEVQEMLMNRSGAQVGGRLRNLFDSKKRSPGKKFFIFQKHIDDPNYKNKFHLARPLHFLDLFEYEQNIEPVYYAYLQFLPKPEDMIEVIGYQNGKSIIRKSAPPMLKYEQSTAVHSRSKRFIRDSCHVYPDRVERFKRVNGRIEIQYTVDKRGPIVLDLESWDMAYIERPSDLSEQIAMAFAQVSQSKLHVIEDTGASGSQEFWMTEGPGSWGSILIQSDDYSARYRSDADRVRPAIQLMYQLCGFRGRPLVVGAGDY